MKLNMNILHDELHDEKPRYFETNKEHSSIINIRWWNSSSETRAAYLYLVDAKDLIADYVTAVPQNVLVHESIYHANLTKFTQSNVLTVDDQVDLSDLFQKLSDLFDNYNEWNEKLLNILASGGSLEEVMSIAVEKLTNPIAIFDTSQTLLYHSKNHLQNYENTIWTPVLAEVYPAPNYYTREESRKISSCFMTSDKAFILQSQKDADHMHLMAPIKTNGQIIGSIGMVDINEPFSEGQVLIVDHVLKIISHIFQLELSRHFSDEDIYYFLRLLNGQTIHRENAEIHLKKLGWNVQEDFYLLIFRTDETLDYIDKSRLNKSRIYSLYPKSLTIYYEGMNVTVLRKKDYDVLVPENRRSLEAFCSEYYLKCAVSNCFQDFLNLRTCYEQCRLLLNLELSETNVAVLSFTEYYEEVIWNALNVSGNSWALCHPRVLELYKSNRKNKEELIDCLYTFLLTGCNMAATARKLYIHRNTLLYRLQTLETILDLKLDDLDRQQFFQLLLSCMIISKSQQHS